MFKCNDCPYYTKHKSCLNRHRKAKHLTKKLLCSLCFYSTNRAGYLTNHVKKCHASILNPSILLNYQKNVDCNSGSEKPDYVMPL
jgi:hypothetical protein